MAKAKRKSPFLLACLITCGAVLTLWPIAEQLLTDAQDAGVYKEIAAVARGPDTTAQDAVSTALSQTPQASSVQPVNQTDVADADDFTALLPDAPVQAESMVDLSALQAQNSDLIGWLRIPGTVIDYPVVQSDKTDYYLHHLFDGQKSKLGCLFSLTSSDYETPSRNIAIYGHHLSTTDAMFSTLVQYKEESWYQEHPLILLESLYGFRTYRIFAVLNQKVTDWDASTADFANEAEFRAYVQRVQQRALFDTGVSVSDEAQILTLITCDRSYGGLRGRLLVMAVEEENKEENPCD